MKTYHLKSFTTPATLVTDPLPCKPHPNTPAARAAAALTDAIAPAPALPPPLPAPRVPAPRPPVQPLPTPVVDPAQPTLKLGLDVHLEFLMAVAQRDHAAPQAPRKFTREQLVGQVRKWIAEELTVYCVQEACGFGFVLHRELIAAGAQSFLITPIALNRKRKTDKLDARALCVRLSRWVDGNRYDLAPIRIPTEAEQHRREATRPLRGSTVTRLTLRNRAQGAARCGGDHGSMSSSLVTLPCSFCARARAIRTSKRGSLSS